MGEPWALRARLPWRKPSPRPFAIVFWWLGADPPSGGFFLNEKTTGKTLEVSLHVFFVFLFCWLFWFQCDMKKNGCFGVFVFFFLGGGVVRGGWGREFLFCWLDLF